MAVAVREGRGKKAIFGELSFKPWRNLDQLNRMQ
jgi:hypothetical protein